MHYIPQKYVKTKDGQNLIRIIYTTNQNSIDNYSDKLLRIRREIQFNCIIQIVIFNEHTMFRGLFLFTHFSKIFIYSHENFIHLRLKLQAVVVIQIYEIYPTIKC